MTNPSSSAAAHSAVPSLAPASAAIAQAARFLLPDLERGRRIDAGILRAAMELRLRRLRCGWRLGLEDRL